MATTCICRVERIFSTESMIVLSAILFNVAALTLENENYMFISPMNSKKLVFVVFIIEIKEMQWHLRFQGWFVTMWLDNTCYDGDKVCTHYSKLWFVLSPICTVHRIVWKNFTNMLLVLYGNEKKNKFLSLIILSNLYRFSSNLVSR